MTDTTTTAAETAAYILRHAERQLHNGQPIGQMSDRHLLNTLRLMLKRGSCYATHYKTVAEGRGLITKGAGLAQIEAAIGRAR